MRQYHALLCLIGAIGCGPSPPQLGFGVATTLSFDDSIDDATLASVASIGFHASGDERFDQAVRLTRSAERHESTLYRPEQATRRLTLAITADDVSGNVLASGRSAEIALVAGETTALDIRLSRELGDSGVDFAGLDLVEVDSTAVDAADAGGDLAPTCPAGAFCEGFDQPSIAPTWASMATLGSVTVDPTNKHAGSSAIHLHTDAVPAGTPWLYSILDTSVPFSLPRTDFWVRAWVYFASPLPPLSAMIVVLQGQAPFTQLELNLDNGKFGLLDGIATPDVAVLTSPMPVDRWFCVEWHIVVGNPGSMNIAIDNINVPGTLIGDTMSGPALGILRLALASGANEPPHNVWFDNVVVHSIRVGCGP